MQRDWLVLRLRLGLLVPAFAAGCAHAPDPGFTMIPVDQFLVTAGKLSRVGPARARVEVPVMRAEIAGDRSESAELTFTEAGTTPTLTPLANGELRRQIGLKFRAQNTCNVIYVMWRLAPAEGVFVSVKSNPTMSTHAQCGANGYDNLHNDATVQKSRPHVDERPHQLHATIEHEHIRVFADGILAFEAQLPESASKLSGPVGVRSDNGVFEFEIRVPKDTRVLRELQRLRTTSCLSDAPLLLCAPTKL